MDREKVIKAYEEFVNGYECFCTSDDYEYEMHKAVLALLKEQEAVSPTWQQGKAYCGSCGKRIPLKISARFCHKCGKRIEWEGR